MDHHDFIQAYLDGELTKQQHAELSDWLAQSEANREAFVRASILDTQIHRQLQHADLHRFLDQLDIHAIQEVIEQTSVDESEALVTAMDADTDQSKQAMSGEPEFTLGRALGIVTRAGGEFAGQRIRKYAVPLGLAAAVALGLTLLFVFQGDNPPTTNPDLVQTPDENIAPAQLATVATLTATHNAQWAEGAFPTGSSLRVGYRLMLTHGFAEITTKRGAVAILEAPCTVEMIDSDNGLELLQGKLVGHCPTRQSQGFLVRTPSTQVIDLGTEFGVGVDAAGETDVYVFTGLVALADPQDDPRVAKLTEVAAGQGKRVDRQGQMSPLTQADAGDRFVRTIDAGASYERLILSDKPVVYYRMDNVIGGIERNRAADRYHAKVFGDVSTITEGGRSSFSLNTAGDYLQTSEPIAELRGAESYTIECWVRATRYEFGSICEIMQMDADQSFANLTGARLETLGKSGVGTLGGSNKLRFVQYEKFGTEPSADNLQRSNAFSKSIYTLNRWVHLAAVKSGQTMTLYLDGEPVGQANEPKSLADTDLAIRIGKFFGTRDSPPVHIRQFVGQLDELAIYDHALPADAIRARVDAGQDWTSP